MAGVLQTTVLIAKRSEQVAGWTDQPKFCRPTETMLMATSPASAD